MSSDRKKIETSDKVLNLVFGMYCHDNPDFAQAFDRCESPIEQLFLAHIALMVSKSDSMKFGSWAVVHACLRDSYGYDDLNDEDLVASMMHNGDVVIILQQPSIACRDVALRPDFAIVLIHEFKETVQAGESDPGAHMLIAARVAIELDGHDWHERTKEQAAVDRQRDRRLAAAGWTVIRFTGSEVYQDVHKCLLECFDVASSLACTAIGMAATAASRKPARRLPAPVPDPAHCATEEAA